MPAVKQPMNTVCSELLPPLGRCQSVSSSDQSEAQMEEENHERQQPDPEDRMGENVLHQLISRTF